MPMFFPPSSGGSTAVTTLVSASRALTNADNGNTLEMASAGLVLTQPSGLAAGFTCNVIPNGLTTVTPASGVLLNGVNASIQRSGSGGSGIFTIIGLASAANSYQVTNTNVGTFAQMQAVSSPATGATFTTTDIGPSRIRWFYNGTLWRPEGGRCVLRNLPADVAGSTAAAEQIMDQVLIPANMMGKDGDTLSIKIGTGKNGTTETVTFTLRLGTTGTVSDTSFQTDNRLSTTNLGLGELLDYRRTSATGIKKIGAIGTNLGWSGATTNANATPTTLAASFAVDQMLSVTFSKTASAEIPTLQTFIVELIAA